ncbi:hypothetical protein BMQ_1599 [Priestia megaterium QM B1551]|uniref:Uncharacterized protein n=1 Tax=Priestia megaterium (strain ATCC 12872 / QMB1551) TaxID=545693 RepID=D5E2K4_PRIM1|nr:hypothetical protein BMQ_1599 [Priestia megaterium QM B1551]
MTRMNNSRSRNIGFFIYNSPFKKLASNTFLHSSNLAFYDVP